MEFELGDNQLKTITLLVGLNHSDFTYGWNGYKGDLYIVTVVVTQYYSWTDIILFPLY